MSDPYAPLLQSLTRLQSEVSTLQQRHQMVREQNDKLVRTGIEMEQALLPYEKGLKIQEEEKMALEAQNSRDNGDVSMSGTQ
ncbi:hypothetical protein SAICODRAFT_7761 [Saitoella complicata NRRL Y-17804]|uniref:uncharacterized protein n=1 Tax=Saitoella complicata (strain BCRC 22490 / CBS 7301 / JCM 7358 / NBRC 10748 / NRRL Y-17804) TaxID=698492 RepID=UPI000867665A|nr:uncharacterized protein SAICODRAFT_7761 [Saitoella complicata NRRL Y-17804]ODQ52724.1 hypothetical protein SAICODRAFT_7761 [Saitoella complicata NRRL Y-17804]